MSTLSTNDLINSFVELFTEAYAGPPNPSSTWFIDNEPDCGIFGVLRGISAAEASKSVDGSGQTGSTIASNVEHLRWSLANVNAEIRGESFGNWKESWQVVYVDDAGWDRLRNALRDEFETLRQAIKSQTDLKGDYLTGLLALLPHAAFHLGIIRQMIDRMRQ